MGDWTMIVHERAIIWQKTVSQYIDWGHLGGNNWVVSLIRHTLQIVGDAAICLGILFVLNLWT